MVTQTSVKTALLNMQVDPILERFLGCIVLGHVPNEVAEAIDNINLRDVPTPLQYIVQVWQGRNRAPKSQDIVMEFMQDTLKDMLP